MNFKIKTNDSNICIKTIRKTKDLLEEIKGLGPKVALVDKSISENYPFILNEFKNLNIQIGNFDKVHHGSSEWNENLRGVISFSLQKKLMNHFANHGSRFYSQYIRANYPSGAFTAKI